MRNAWILILCAGSIWMLSNPTVFAQTPPSGRPFQIVTSNLPPPEIGVEYKAEIRVVGGKPPYQWTILQQSLPRGLTLDSARGVIFGTSQSDAQFSVLVQVADSSEPPLTITKLIVSNPGPLLAIRWTDRPHISLDHMAGAVRVKNGSKDDVDLVVIVVAVNEYGKAFALRYERLTVPRGAETPDLKFDSSLPLGQYTLHADAVGEVAAKNAIYRDRRELPGFVVQSQ
jgi:putative Ig domain-containing protein